MTGENIINPVEIQGIAYYHHLPGEALQARDGKVNIQYGNFPLPLVVEDFALTAGDAPTYDMVGRGLYHALRANPDAPFSVDYAHLLKNAYPHLLAELATHLVMLDNKDVDVPYLDRKINYLKIFALLEPENHHFPLEIGTTLLEKGLSLAALNHTTVLLYQAETYLARSNEMKPDDLQVKHQLAEVSFILGRYDTARSLWSELAADLSAEAATPILKRLQVMTSGRLPAAPAVDYLQAIGVAMELYAQADYEEAVAIILDAMDALALFEAFPLAEINYILGLCYLKLDIPRYAENCFQTALQISPGYEDAARELRRLEGKE